MAWSAECLGSLRGDATASIFAGVPGRGARWDTPWNAPDFFRGAEF